MNPPNVLRTLLFHNDWARDRLLDAAEGVTDEQLDQPFDMGMGSLRATLHHLWRAERVWLDRWQEKEVDVPPAQEPDLGLADLRERFRATARERNTFLKGPAKDLESRRIAYTNTKGESYAFPLGDMLLHVSNHGFHHRAQALNMIRQLGGTPPPLDYLFMKLDPGSSPATHFEADVLAEYFRYGDWARDQILPLAEQLTDEALDLPAKMGMGSLRKTLLHIQAAEQWWVRNWAGDPSPGFVQLPDTTSIESLGELARATAEKRDTFLASLTDEDMQRKVKANLGPKRKFEFAIGDSMIQLGGHGTHHRAQALNLLRRAGRQVPELDYLVWIEAVDPAATVS